MYMYAYIARAFDSLPVRVLRWLTYSTCTHKSYISYI
jgi:hypothetical protein